MNDPNCGDFLQEFAHLIGQALEEKPNGGEFGSRLESVYEAAQEAGLWRGKLASVNSANYWAETVRYWFWETLPPSLSASRPKLADYDPQAARLIEDVFGEARLPSVCKP